VRWAEAALWLAVAVAGMAVVLLRTRGGPHLSPDSVSYVQSARNLAAGRGLVTFNGEPYVDWPPLFPAVLAAVSALGIDAEQAARWVNAAAFGTIAAAGGWWVRRRTGSLAAGAAASAVLLRAAALVFVAEYAWSEPLFLLLSLLALIALAAFARRGDGRTLAAAGLLTAGAVLTRYVGLAAIGAGAMVILARPDGWRRKTRNAALFGALSCLPLAAWLARNARITGTLTGGRAVVAASLPGNVRLLLLAAGTWLLPPSVAEGARIAAGCALAAATVLAAARLRRGGPRGDVLPPFALAVLYAALLLAMATFTPMDQIGDRLVAPLLPPVVLVLALAAPAVRARGRGWTVAAAGLLAAWLAFSPLRTPEGLDAEASAVDYAMPRWRRAPLAAWLRAHPPRGGVFSNEPWGLFETTRISAAAAPGSPDADGDPDLPIERAELGDSVDAGRPQYLVWWAQPDTDASPDDALGEGFAAELVHREPSGAVYLIRRP
jgi:4-amino-4-deoxy-L-arabinose transferase-like glycosyltransferase